MQTSEEENMKIWKLIETSCSDCIKTYREENKKDPLEREYEVRVDFWNRYIEDQLANIEFRCNKKYYYEFRKNLIYQAHLSYMRLVWHLIFYVLLQAKQI